MPLILLRATSFFFRRNNIFMNTYQASIFSVLIIRTSQQQRNISSSDGVAIQTRCKLEGNMKLKFKLRAEDDDVPIYILRRVDLWRSKKTFVYNSLYIIHVVGSLNIQISHAELFYSSRLPSQFTIHKFYHQKAFRESKESK